MMYKCQKLEIIIDCNTHLNTNAIEWKGNLYTVIGNRSIGAATFLL